MTKANDSGNEHARTASRRAYTGVNIKLLVGGKLRGEDRSSEEERRKRKAKETGVSPPTCFQCSFHEVAVCRKHNCWERHLAEVRQNQRDGFEI